MGSNEKTKLSNDRLDYLLENYEIEHGKKLTHKQLAEKLLLSPSTISRIYSGDRKLYEEEIKKLAKFLNITCDEVITGVKPENKQYNTDYGLEDKTLNWLRKNKSCETSMYILNMLFKEDDIIKLLLDSMYFYIILSKCGIIVKDEHEKVMPRLSDNTDDMAWSAVSSNVQAVFKNITYHCSNIAEEPLEARVQEIMNNISKRRNSVKESNMDKYLADIGED